jgi:hypothetical protein
MNYSASTIPGRRRILDDLTMKSRAAVIMIFLGSARAADYSARTSLVS